MEKKSIRLISCVQTSNDRRRRVVEGHTVVQEIRPGAGFETGDLVDEKLEGLP